MRTKRITYVWQYALIAVFVTFIGAPILWLVSIAFKSPQEILTLESGWIPNSPTLDNFVVAISEQPLIRSAVNSLLVAGTSAVLTVILAVPAAYLMSRYRGKLSSVMVGWVLLSQMFPFIIILIPLFLTAIRVGLYDSLLGLILVYTVWSLPFAMWILRNFIDGIPRELEEQAMTDGAGRWASLRLVVGPLLAPGLVTAAMFSFIGAWNEFFFALVLIKDESLSPLSLLIVRFIGQDSVRLGPLAAASLLAIIPSLMFFAAIQKRLTSSLISGAVKG